MRAKKKQKRYLADRTKKKVHAQHNGNKIVAVKGEKKDKKTTRKGARWKNKIIKKAKICT